MEEGRQVHTQTHQHTHKEPHKLTRGVAASSCVAFPLRIRKFGNAINKLSRARTLCAFYFLRLVVWAFIAGRERKQASSERWRESRQTLARKHTHTHTHTHTHMQSFAGWHKQGARSAGVVRATMKRNEGENRKWGWGEEAACNKTSSRFKRRCRLQERCGPCNALPLASRAQQTWTQQQHGPV